MCFSKAFPFGNEFKKTENEAGRMNKKNRQKSIQRFREKNGYGNLV
jgi:hypothetical protein